MRAHKRKLFALLGEAGSVICETQSEGREVPYAVCDVDKVALSQLKRKRSRASLKQSLYLLHKIACMRMLI